MHRAVFSALIIIIGTTTAVAPVLARPPKGFHEGPYLMLEVGAIQSDFDTDQQSGEQVGRDIEPAFGFIFGWNVWDQFAAELKGEYATNINTGRREHIVTALVTGRYTPIVDQLTDFQSFRIFPFLKAGGGARVYALPGNTLSSEQLVSSIGFGPSVGSGVICLWKKYFYFGVDIREDFFFYEDVHQNLDLATPPLTDQLIYRGGFHPAFSAMATVGVHY